MVMKAFTDARDLRKYIKEEIPSYYYILLYPEELKLLHIKPPKSGYKDYKIGSKWYRIRQAKDVWNYPNFRIKCLTNAI